MFPLFLNLTGRLVLVVGGGAVGRRKAAALLDSGARVRVVCPEPTTRPLPDVEWLQEPYSVRHLDGVALVVAAASPEVNEQVVADARARGLWVNDAAQPEEGDFYLPAVLRRGDFVVAVSTGGAAPSLARAVCRRLELEFDDTFGRWVALLAELRPRLRQRIRDPKTRRIAFERLCRWEWLERLRREGVEVVRGAMADELDSLADGSASSL